MKQYGLEFIIPELPKWRQRIWYVSRKARNIAFKKLGGKKITREV